MKRMLKEKWVSSSSTRAASGKAFVEIFKNPDRGEIRDAFKRDFIARNYKELRGIATDLGDLYIVTCEDDELIHDMIIQVLAEQNYLQYNSGWEGDPNPDYYAIVIQPDFDYYLSTGSYALDIIPRGYKDMVEEIAVDMPFLNFIDPEVSHEEDEDPFIDDEFFDDSGFSYSEGAVGKTQESMEYMSRGSFDAIFSIYENPEPIELEELRKSGVMVRGILKKSGDLYLAGSENFIAALHDDIIGSLIQEGYLSGVVSAWWSSFKTYERFVPVVLVNKRLFLSASLDDEMIEFFKEQYYDEYHTKLKLKNPRLDIIPEQ